MAEQSLVVTLDLEDHRPDDTHAKNYPKVTRKLLNFLEQRKLRATVFVLGRLAREEPSLIQEIDQRGHEIAYHSAQHLHLTKDSPDNFFAESKADLDFISEIINKPVYGYRAPAFSLTPDSMWAVDAIKSLGFEYSSSVMPVHNPINGFPSAPRTPFYWPNGLLELPAAVASVGPLTLPFLGGIYLRYLPIQLIRSLLARRDPKLQDWIYCHPHDFDTEERFFQIRGTSLLVSLLLWLNRAGTFAKLAKMLPDEVEADLAQTFKEKIDCGQFRDALEFEL